MLLSFYSFPLRITVEIPDELAQQMAALGGDPARILLENFAAESYRAGKMTMEQVRQLFGCGNAHAGGRIAAAAWGL